MRVGIRDLGTLSSVQSALLASYLRSRGWRPGPRVRDLATAWSHTLPDGESIEVLVPLDRRAADFAHRIGEVLRALEIVEQRSQLEVLADISKVAADTIRVRVEGPAISDGT